MEKQAPYTQGMSVSDIKKDLTLLLKKYRIMPESSGQVLLHITNGAVGVIETTAINRYK